MIQRRLRLRVLACDRGRLLSDAPTAAHPWPHTVQYVEERGLRHELMHNERVVLDWVEREAHVQDDVRMAQRVGHLQLLQKVHDLALRVQHVFRTKLSQADLHPQPIRLVERAPVRLAARLLYQVTLPMERELGEVDEELEAAQRLDVDIFCWVDYPFIELTFLFLLEETCQVIRLRSNSLAFFRLLH